MIKLQGLHYKFTHGVLMPLALGFLWEVTLQSVCGQAATNMVLQLEVQTNAPRESVRLQLTPAMKRLQGSPYFDTEVNQIDQVMWNHLSGNRVGSRYLHTVFFDARRRMDVMGDESFSISVMSFFERPNEVYYFPSNAVLKLWIDGHTCTSPASRTTLDVKGAYERLTFPVPDQWISGIGAARSVQFQIEGDTRSLQRTLDRTNISRFKVFADTFIGAGLH